ncbi:MAG: hypothetical protein NVSMB45_04660 [Ginsengibacter sp.]
MANIFSRHPIKSYLVFSVIAAVLYCIAAGVFIAQDSFASSWVLFIGNVLFAIVIAVFILTYNRRYGMNAKAQVMVFAGHITAVMGILLSCTLILILFAILTPHIYQVAANNQDALEKAPPTLQGNGHGLMLVLFMSAVVGNIAASSFISILLPFTAKRFQKDNS